ncbi:hypothetical protein FT663_03677 [Candidozyma haemuli var. vulneris]|uniref:37S ribosomal protein S25, mitochondrial n=1 Tax=Candidozyma haemuli TaxID=45357 RepID=A0A2V1AT67_9ASCO|nr:hypothetical protein CXQ85_004460 [[Candida] haemuloni]KAF3987778.1 hypothetical protein FT662_03796 [[Candida] haemuloni var. vulneris]KAF3989255.1 hypothetical protein FT663_03677 [[Candida] haemuloni var. vulneris]PVH20944.1 hypothetical protein CXQ85_004460 [[Candida] haemuloni]
MKIQHNATRVLERTSHFLQKGVLLDRPAWVNSVGVHPTGYDMTKRPKKLEAGRQPVDPQDLLAKKKGNYYNTRTSRTDRRNTHGKVNAIPKIKLLEDQLRDVFYHQHPWELARPKNLVETQGDDNAHCDWSRMLQLSKPLDGESVVQRTLYLLKDKPKAKGTLFEAYDQARFEFYQLRMAEEMEATVSREESTMYGSIYPSTNTDWGIQKEQEAIDDWAPKATEETRALRATMGTSKTLARNDAEEDDGPSIWESSVGEDQARE